MGCTVENQAAADRRLPLLLGAPLRHKLIVCAPLLGPLDIAQYLTSEIEEVSAGGESGSDAVRATSTGCFRSAGSVSMRTFPSATTRRAHGSSKTAGCTASAAGSSTRRPARRE